MDKILNFEHVLAEVIKNRGLKMIDHPRVIWRHGQPKDDPASNQEYRLFLEDRSSGQQSNVTLLIDDESTADSVRSQLEQGLEQ